MSRVDLEGKMMRLEMGAKWTDLACFGRRRCRLRAGCRQSRVFCSDEETSDTVRGRR